MDIIAAIATPAAVSAIGIVRVSGAGCFDLCERVFRPLHGRAFSAAPARQMIYGDVLCADGAVIDRALAVRFPGPHSYTGEDSVEFHCHGSPVVLRTLLDTLFAYGARQALPGEYTKRAFLSGQMDLTQAEAVIDLIDAETAAAAKCAMAQLDGALRRPLEQVQDALLELTSRFYAVVDYPDEDIEDIAPAEIAAALAEAKATLARLLSTAARGKLLKNGVRTAIIGRPNAGKSSLLNALVGYERAIVTDIPGTTRDTVEESVLCGGVLLRLTDTAGIRETEDAVEKLGVARSRSALDKADLVLAVVDGSEAPTAEDETILSLAARQPLWILVRSKADLSAAPMPPLRFAEGAHPPAAVVWVSAVTGEGLEALTDAVAKLFPSGSSTEIGSLLTDQRQEDAVRRALSAVECAEAAFSGGLTPDAVLTDAEEALNALGELTGRTAREDIVERIFSRFCVGK